MWHITEKFLFGIVLAFILMQTVPAVFAASPFSKVQVQFDVPEKKQSEVTSNPGRVPVPFARQEQALRYSDSWEKMTPEEQEEALANIRQLSKDLSTTTGRTLGKV